MKKIANAKKPEKREVVQEKASESCNDKLCPVHGKLRLRGRQFTGEVISSKMHKTATVQWDRAYFLPKYERYEKRKTMVKAHNPGCIDAEEGDFVRISETRPLSKTKNFVIIEKLDVIKGFKEKQEALEEAKVKEAVKESEETEGKNEGSKS